MATLLPVTNYCASLLQNPPDVGAGRHTWLFKVAASMYRSNCKPEKIREFLVKECVARGWQDRLADIDKIFTTLDAGLLPTDTSKLPPWPYKHHEERRKRFAHAAMFDALNPLDVTTEEVIRTLYQPDDLICVGWKVWQYSTMPAKEFFLTAKSAEYIVANVMTAETSSSGSKRSKAIASLPERRKYAVVEFDTGDTREEQAAVLSSLHSPQHPLVLAVWSAGKSIHGWFNVGGLSPYLKLRFFRFAAWLGADETLYDMAKLVRMPGGRRKNGKHQEILYWEPEHA